MFYFKVLVVKKNKCLLLAFEKSGCYIVVSELGGRFSPKGSESGVLS
jgi:hypothetical protein